MTIELTNLVRGSFVTDADHGVIEVRNPADARQVVALLPSMGAEQVERALAAAFEARKVWREQGALGRASVLTRAAQLLRDRSEDIAADLVREMGKTTDEATVEVAKSADFFDYYAGLARGAQGYRLADGRPSTTVDVAFEPVGVVVAITPWNDPLLTPSRKLAPALAVGNCVILKPSTETPVVAWHLARALNDAGLPAGVLATITGRSKDVVAPLVCDERVAAVTFTGSTEVGLALQRELAGSNRRIQTEMGGKNASVVLDGADLDLAAQTITAASFAQAGQRCTATSRIIVQKSVADALVARLLEHAEQLRVGPGDDPTTTVCPVINRGHRDAILASVQDAVEAGATVVSGGTAPPEPQLAHGSYVTPTIVTGVTPEMAIWRDELFGPVVAVHVVDDFDAAVAATNDSVYGLSAAVFTADLDLSRRFACLVDAGQISINLPTSGWDVHHPFGGFALSGSSFKEQGTEGLSFYRRVKTIAVRSGR